MLNADRNAPAEPNAAQASMLARVVVPLLVVVSFCLLASHLITGRAVVKDAATTLRMAINLQHHGVLSLADEPPYVPSMWREPVPALTEAVAVWLVDAVKGPAQPGAYLSGERARLIKVENLFWLALLMLSAAAAVRHFGGGTAWQVGGMLLVALPFTFLVIGPERAIIGVDCLTTELPGAALLLAASLALAQGIPKPNWKMLVLASTLFGLLALTKAAVFYIYLVVVALLALAISVRTRRAAESGVQVMRLCGALLVPFVLLTGTWMYRDYHQLGSLQIAERSGPIVLYRGMLTGMTRTEYLGSFYAWSIWPIQPLVGRLTGFSQSDLGGEGRLRRLPLILPGSAGAKDQQAEDSARPQDAITWYRQSRAVYQLDLQRLVAAGFQDAQSRADAATKREGLRLLASHPLMEVALLLPMLWAGAALTFPLLVWALVWSWRTRRLDLAAYALPAFGIVLFYAMFTQFDARYGWLPRPIATIATVIMLASMLRIRDRLAAPHQPAIALPSQ
jgi:hypothetical protein